VTRYWPEALVFILELLLAAFPFLGNTSAIFFREPVQGFLTVMSLQIVVLVIYLMFRTSLERSKTESTLREIRDDINRLSETVPRVSVIYEDQFYSEFQNAIGKASKAVALSHLDIKPPQQLPGTPAKTYYDNLRRIVRQNPGVRFKRVERIAPEKLAWIEKLVEDFKGYKNFSLACLEIPYVEAKTPYVSVQLIDDSATYICAVARHYSPYTPRDILINDASANSLWRTYFEESLWEAAIKVIEDGTLNESNWKRIVSEGATPG